MKDLNDMLKQMTVFEYRMDQWKKPSLLEKMSKWDQTERICLEAVRENSHALKYVSKRIVNYEICKRKWVKHLPYFLIVVESCLKS